MNTRRKIESPFQLKEEDIGSRSHQSLLPQLQNSNFSPYDGVVLLQQHSYGLNYLNPISELAHDHSGQLAQNKYYRCFSEPSFGEKAVSKNCESSSGNSQDASNVFLFNSDCRAQTADSKGTLQSKTRELLLACSNTSVGKQSSLPRGQLMGFEHGAIYDSETCSPMQNGRAGPGKQRIRWTHELHEQFVAAVSSLGGAMKATPKGILGLMETQGLTIFHIKSHLQKYRTAKCNANILEAGKFGGTTSHNVEPVSNIKASQRTEGHHISETLRLQMDVQKNLHEHLEFQRKLQARIEDHASYLQNMFEQQKKGHSTLENENMKRAIDKSLAESSSPRGYG